MGEPVSIDEKTKISLFALLASLSSVVIIAMWLAGLSAKTDQALANSIENEKRVDRQTDILLEIKERVTRIEEKLSRGKNERD